jgi:putative oxygen-independent coproporphyrinogen III oxidase
MTPLEADGYAHSAAAYVHIPFCSAVCPYCDFAVVAGQDHLAARYIDAVCSEIAGATPWRSLDSVYFGGGTPSHVDPALLGRVLDALAARHGIAGDAEVSLEANPEDFTTEQAKSLHDLGFNRVSFGAQSFDNQVLSSLGRRHVAPQIDASVRAARQAGFDNISLDLIYGTPGETAASWRNSLERGLGTNPDHISCYALTVEPGTPLGRSVRNGAEGPDPDVQADRYEAADRILNNSGFSRYEVSSWSLPRRECRYNLTVWAQGEYEAYGNGAHGFRAGRRFRNHRRLDAYIERIESSDCARAGEEVIAGWDAEIDRLFVGLRRSVGVARGDGTEALLASKEGRMLLEAGVLAERDVRLVIRRPLMTDAVHRSLLGLDGPIVLVDSDA